MSIRISLTDLAGNTIANVRRFDDAEVEIPLSDSRTARFTVSCFDPVAQYIKPLSVMAKIWWYDYLVFWGFCLSPQFTGSSGTLDVVCHDPSLRLKRHYHTYGDDAVNDPMPPDGRGLWVMVQSAIPTDAQLADGVLGPGIYQGFDGSVWQENAAMWSKNTRGTNVWESMGRLAEGVPGVEFELRPVDEYHPLTRGNADTGRDVVAGWTRDDGYYCQLDAYPIMGMPYAHKEDTVVWHYGWGRQNLDDFTWEPAGDEETNYAVVNNPGGDNGEVDADNRAVASLYESWKAIGIYESWESVGEKWPVDVLQVRAEDMVQANSPPPEHFTITPSREGPNIYRYMRDFVVGDFTRAIAKKGYFSQEVIGRIVRVTLRHTSLEGSKAELECLPYEPQPVTVIETTS